MDLLDCKVVINLYELKSINQTAKKLQYSPANISTRLKKIEATLANNLFVRTPSGLIATEAGQKVYRYSQQVMQLTEQLQQQLSQPTTKRIVSSELLYNEVVMHQQLYPLTAAATIVKTSAINAQLNSSQLAFCFQRLDEPNWKLIACKQLRASFVGANNLTLQTPLIVNADKSCPLRKQSVALLPAQPLLEVDSWTAITQLVEAKKGVALLPDWEEFASLPHLNLPQIKIPYFICEKS